MQSLYKYYDHNISWDELTFSSSTLIEMILTFSVTFRILPFLLHQVFVFLQFKAHICILCTKGTWLFFSPSEIKANTTFPI